MGIRLRKKLFLRFGVIVLLALMLIAESGVTRAIGGPVLSISIAFDQTLATIGRTPLLTIDVSSVDSNPIRITSFKCTSFGTSLTSNSINPQPSSIVPNSSFRAQQLYRANTAGVTQVTCAIAGVDTVTGLGVGATSTAAGVNVLAETRLYFDVNSASKTATLGQTVYVIAKFGNRGKTPFTNLEIQCIEFGRSFVFVSEPTLQSTILPGQSGFVQYALQATRPGGTGLISCQLTATDSTNGQQVTLPAPTVKILIK